MGEAGGRRVGAGNAVVEPIADTVVIAVGIVDAADAADGRRFLGIADAVAW